MPLTVALGIFQDWGTKMSGYRCRPTFRRQVSRTFTKCTANQPWSDSPSGTILGDMHISKARYLQRGHRMLGAEELGSIVSH